MKKISIIGTGNVGSLTVQYLLKEKLGHIFLINRHKKISEGLLLDTVSAFPDQYRQISLGTAKDIYQSDLILITAGIVLRSDLDLEGLRIVKTLAKKYKFNPRSLVVFTTTPIDEAAELFQMLTGHPKNRVMGFGGSLDLARLKYLLAKKTGNNPKKIKGYYLGMHGTRGLALFDLQIKNPQALRYATSNYYKEIVKRTGHSTIYGPASQLADLAKALLQNKKTPTEVSTWLNDYGMYATWPVKVSRSGVTDIIKVKLNPKEKIAIYQLLNFEKKRRKNLFKMALG